MKRSKEQGEYRLKKAIQELHILEENVKEIEDDIDKYDCLLRIDEVIWCIKEGLKDLQEGE